MIYFSNYLENCCIGKLLNMEVTLTNVKIRTDAKLLRSRSCYDVKYNFYNNDD